jgi:hypothetical protein
MKTMKREAAAAALILLALLMGIVTTAATSGCDVPAKAAGRLTEPSTDASALPMTKPA